MQIIFSSYFSSFFAESELDDLIDEIIKTNNRGVSIGRNGSAVASWSFGQSFFFSSTVVTTIGYGHQTPLSPEGKFFCILYALIGIPMTMLLITAVVDKLMMPVNLLLIWINNTMGHLYSPFSLRLFHLLLVIYVSKKIDYIIISVRFWNFKDGGSQKARFLAKNQHTQRKSLYFVIMGSTSLSKSAKIILSKSILDVKN